MKFWMLGLAITSSLASGTARADQCAWIDATAAKRAEAILANKPQVIAYCEPCGDNAPGIPESAERVEVTSPQAGYKAIQINGRDVDLAYTFVQTSMTHYHNLAKLAGCEADGVSSSLAIANETPSGVLITPDEQPVAEPQTSAAAVSVPTAIAAPPPPAPPAPVIVYVTTTQTVPWIAIAMTALGAFATGTFALGTIATIRRRRAMQPRATNLPRT